MKYLLNLFALIVATQSFAQGLLQDADFKTESELVTAGGSASDLLNDTKIWISADSINKTLDDAIVDGDIAGSDVTTKGDLQTHDGTDATRLPVGANGQFLVADSDETTGLLWSDSLTGTLSDITEWEAFTPTGSWSTNTTYTGKIRYVGDTAEVQYRIDLAGAPNSTSLTLDLPSGVAADEAKMEITNDETIVIGSGQGINTGIFEYKISARYQSTPNNIRIDFLSEDGASETVLEQIDQASPFTWGNTDELEVTVKFPVEGRKAVAQAVIESQEKNVENSNEFVATSVTGGTVSNENLDWINGSCTQSNGRWNCPLNGDLDASQLVCEADSVTDGAVNCHMTNNSGSTVDITCRNDSAALTNTTINISCVRGDDFIKKQTIVATLDASNVNDAIISPNLTDKEKVCSFETDGSSTPVSNDYNNCVNGAGTRTSTGNYDIDFESGYFKSGEPVDCYASGFGDSIGTAGIVDDTGALLRTKNVSTGANINIGMSWRCYGSAP